LGKMHLLPRKSKFESFVPKEYKTITEQ
jgi:hypothetical protein